MNRRDIKVNIRGAIQQVPALLRVEEGIEEVGIIVSGEGQWYTSHGLIELLYLPTLVEYIYHNTITSHEAIENILRPLGLVDAYDYYINELDVFWIPLSESFQVLYVCGPDQETVILKSTLSWIEPAE